MDSVIKETKDQRKSTNSEDPYKSQVKCSLTQFSLDYRGLPDFLNLSRFVISQKFNLITQYENNMRAKSTPFFRNAWLSNRNRYADILPWTHNIIKLGELSFPANYINASPVYLGRQQHFIATQGPGIGNTVEHFWQMTWQENVEVIVMLTQFIEAGRLKCGVYLPIRPGQEISVQLGLEPNQGFVKCLSRQVNKWGEVRELLLYKMKDNYIHEQRRVHHLFFMRWPDQRVPLDKDDQIALTNLIQLSRRNISHSPSANLSPRIVHCSAGVGRTGTFIALDHLIQEIDEGRWDNLRESVDPVYETVLRLREQRMGLVNNLEQYSFIYQVLRDRWLERQ